MQKEEEPDEVQEERSRLEENREIGLGGAVPTQSDSTVERSNMPKPSDPKTPTTSRKKGEVGRS